MTFENKEKEIGFSAAILFIFLIKNFFSLWTISKRKQQDFKHPYIHHPQLMANLASSITTHVL